MVEYAFDVDGKLHTGKGSIRQPPERAITVFFDPQDPSENWPDRPGLWFPGIVCAVLAALSIASGLAWRKARHREAAAAAGQEVS